MQQASCPRGKPTRQVSWAGSQSSRSTLPIQPPAQHSSPHDPPRPLSCPPHHLPSHPNPSNFPPGPAISAPNHSNQPPGPATWVAFPGTPARWPRWPRPPGSPFPGTPERRLRVPDPNCHSGIPNIQNLSQIGSQMKSLVFDLVFFGFELLWQIAEMVGVKALPTYVTRAVSKFWKRFLLELSLEWALLLENWKLILGGLLFQYVHGVGARIAHYQHHPGPLLHDVGFQVLPELGKQNAHISESLFSFVFVSFVLWSIHPFFLYNKRFYTVVLWMRVLMCLVICQSLRMASFMVTQLPGPNYHCHEGEPTATLPPPKIIKEVLLLNFPYGVIYGCGDLIFSSHMTFALTFFHAYMKYGMRRWIKFVAFLVMVALSLLIIASRKHYSVDIVVAWYVVFLVFFFVDRRLAEAGVPERVMGNGPPLLPMNAGKTGKEGRSKEEKTLLNGHATENGSAEL